MNLSVPRRLQIMMLLTTASLVGYGLWSWNTLSVVKVNGPHYETIVDGKDLIADILPPPNYIIESYLMVLHISNELDEGISPQELQQEIERLAVLQNQYKERHLVWVNKLPEGELRRKKTIEAHKPAMQFYNCVNEQFLPACIAGDVQSARRLVRGSLRENYDQHRAVIDEVVQLAETWCAESEASFADVVSTRAALSIFFLVAAIATCAGFGWWTTVCISNTLKTSATALKSVACANLKDIGAQIRDDASLTSSQVGLAQEAAESVTTNVQSLATAVEQFDTSIREISTNTTSAVAVAATAVAAADETSSKISKLGESSSEISNVIKVINSIAEQTNLLALNATIEAARAGESGRGFAVVANEVKELAKQTSAATEAIIGHIEAIQTDTSHAVMAIKKVSSIINEINESQNAIASAVEEQSAMTGEISRNIVEVSGGSQCISDNINYVADAASSTTQRSEDSIKATDDVELLAQELMLLVGETQDFISAAPHRGKYQLSAESVDELSVQ